MEILVLIDKLDDTVHNAALVPLTDQVRVDRQELRGIVDEMRATIPEEIRQARAILDKRGARGRPASEADMDPLALLDRLDEVVRQARPVPLIDQVRVDREEVYDILDRLRATIPEEIKGARELLAREGTGDAGAATAAITSVSVEEASRSLADLVQRVRFGGESFSIELAGVPMARLSPPPE